MMLSPHVEKRLLRGLRIMAGAEKAGRAMPARELGLELGMSESAGLETRRLLIDLGLLVEERPTGTGKPVTRISDGGWYALGEKPSAGATTKARTVRRCLMCRNDFEPDGPMFVCSPCKGTDAWRASTWAF